LLDKDAQLSPRCARIRQLFGLGGSLAPHHSPAMMSVMTLPPDRTVIRPATRADVPLILTMIRELAEFERSLHEVQATEELLTQNLFAEQPAVFCHIAEIDGEAVGFALWFVNFSTWVGKHGIYLDDLYVRPAARGGGVGTALLQTLARICVERGYDRLDWWVLDWNEKAIGFYQSIDAIAMDEWTVQRLTGEPLRRMAGTVSP
jgi:GNAT superfamily N-acetyltransferase